MWLISEIGVILYFSIGRTLSRLQIVRNPLQTPDFKDTFWLPYNYGTPLDSAFQSNLKIRTFLDLIGHRLSGSRWERLKEKKSWMGLKDAVFGNCLRVLAKIVIHCCYVFYFRNICTELNNKLISFRYSIFLFCFQSVVKNLVFIVKNHKMVKKKWVQLLKKRWPICVIFKFGSAIIH